MPRSANQKSKILYLMKILLDYTDETHMLSMSELTAKLAEEDIKAERDEQMPWLSCVHDGLFHGESKRSLLGQEFDQNTYNRWHHQQLCRHCVPRVPGSGLYGGLSE